MNDNQNWKRVATKFEDTTEKINDHGNFRIAKIDEFKVAELLK